MSLTTSLGRPLRWQNRLSACFGLSYAGVDLVEGPDGFLVYEVSAFGGFRGLHEAYGLDAARLFAGYVLRSLA